VKLVKDELTELMGGDVAGINLSKSYSYLDVRFTGKTTFPENWPIIFKQKNKTAFSGFDIYRPAAIQQLYVVGDSIS
jgi:signal recognition particle subunit SRP54